MSTCVHIHAHTHAISTHSHTCAVCLHTYLHTHVHMCSHMCMFTHPHIHTHTPTLTCTNMLTHRGTHTNDYICTYQRTHMHTQHTHVCTQTLKYTHLPPPLHSEHISCLFSSVNPLSKPSDGGGGGHDHIEILYAESQPWSQFSWPSYRPLRWEFVVEVQT